MTQRRTLFAHRTYQAVERQLWAMGEVHYEVGVHRTDGTMLLRTWTCKQTLAAVPWLSYMNTKGSHIYVRPLQSVGLVMLDDLQAQAVQRLKLAGLEPSVVLETSPGNYQCWIRLIENAQRRELPAQLIRNLLRYLANEYNTDSRSTDWRHFGRLAGFTNRKPKHQVNGRSPFVLLHFAEPTIARNGRLLLQRARLLATREKRGDGSTGRASEVGRSYHERVVRILTLCKKQAWVHSPDYSRLDFMIAREMLMEGVPADAVERAILEGSPELKERKRSHMQDYVQRTVRAAAQEQPLSLGAGGTPVIQD